MAAGLLPLSASGRWSLNLSIDYSVVARHCSPGVLEYERIRHVFEGGASVKSLKQGFNQLATLADSTWNN